MSDTEKITGTCPKVSLAIPHYVDVRLAEINQKFKGQKKALKLAENAMNYKFQSINGLHGEMRRDQATYARADDMEVKHLALDDKIDSHVKTINEKLVGQDKLIQRGVGIILTAQFCVLVAVSLIVYFAN